MQIEMWRPSSDQALRFYDESYYATYVARLESASDLPRRDRVWASHVQHATTRGRMPAAPALLADDKTWGCWMNGQGHKVFRPGDIFQAQVLTGTGDTWPKKMRVVAVAGPYVFGRPMAHKPSSPSVVAVVEPSP